MVSCSSNEDPEQVHKYLELAGTWKATGYVEPYIINIDNDGNFSFISKDSPFYGIRFYNYTGKLADNFEYPYTIELVYDIYSSVSLGDMTQSQYNNTYKAFSPQKGIGKFIFIDASTCEANFDEIHIGQNRWVKNRICSDNNRPEWKEYTEWRYTSFKKTIIIGKKLLE